jgi:hypothetical protein
MRPVNRGDTTPSGPFAHIRYRHLSSCGGLRFAGERTQLPNRGCWLSLMLVTSEGLVEVVSGS